MIAHDQGVQYNTARGHPLHCAPMTTLPVTHPGPCYYLLLLLPGIAPDPRRGWRRAAYWVRSWTLHGDVTLAPPCWWRQQTQPLILRVKT
ncbi:hypothetical protein GDO81_022468 [Engystomops pustulosus]|uniref:Uncharacterized protein n=1 Tax=Engystomops pustulosus TaxID=76066 RepID=A0AAV6YRZ5_ENGPU|nr:hypothetical protein GDO81_022468 [Engystomops pustulosus]